MKPRWLEEALSWRPGYAYICTPYSLYSDGQEAAFIAAAQYTGWLLAEGVHVFSPIVHSHPIATYTKLDPLDHTIWMRNDRPMIEAAAGAIVVKLPGWATSRGVAEEIAIVKSAGKPIIYVEIDELGDPI